MNPPPAFYPKHMASAASATATASSRKQPRLSSSTSVAFSGLPVPFIQSMKKLFDILDTRKSGFVKYSEIASRWNCSSSRNNFNISGVSPEDLPEGVIEHLKKVTNAQGYLTFERFCAGLKIAILRHEANKRDGDDLSVKTEEEEIEEGPYSPASSCSPNSTVSTNTSSMSTSSSKVLPVSPDKYTDKNRCNNPTAPPPKPPRDPAILKSISRESLFLNRPLDHNYMNYDEINQPNNIINKNYGNGELRRVMSEIQPAPNNINKNYGNGELRRVVSEIQPAPSRRVNVKRNNSHARRHTLTCGLDFNMLKRMQQWEEEKTVLEEGLTAIKNAEEWYTNRLNRVQERLKFQSDNYCNDDDLNVNNSLSTTEAAQEKMMFELGSIQELNQRLTCLVTSGLPGGYPSFMNLEIRKPAIQEQDKTIQRLKEQNRLLTEEVSRKCNVIGSLEREKGSIIKQLFQSRAIINQMSQQHHFNDEEHTFM